MDRTKVFFERKGGSLCGRLGKRDDFDPLRPAGWEFRREKWLWRRQKNIPYIFGNLDKYFRSFLGRYRRRGDREEMLRKMKCEIHRTEAYAGRRLWQHFWDDKDKPCPLSPERQLSERECRLASEDGTLDPERCPLSSEDVRLLLGERGCRWPRKNSKPTPPILFKRYAFECPGEGWEEVQAPPPDEDMEELKVLLAFDVEELFVGSCLSYDARTELPEPSGYDFDAFLELAMWHPDRICKFVSEEIEPVKRFGGRNINVSSSCPQKGGDGSGLACQVPSEAGAPGSVAVGNNPPEVGTGGSALVSVPEATAEEDALSSLSIVAARRRSRSILARPNSSSSISADVVVPKAVGWEMMVQPLMVHQSQTTVDLV